MNGSSSRTLQPPPPPRSSSSSRGSSPSHSPTRSAVATPLDLTALLAEDDAFESEAAWLNSILTPPSASTSKSKNSQDGTSQSLVNLDVSLARTLALLDVATHDTSSLVDRTIDDISRSVPRLSFDLQLMRENALLLRLTLDGIRKRAASAAASSEGEVEGAGATTTSVSKVMDKLRVLDLVKSRMEAARDVLREAESWSTLESEVTALVGEQAYSKAAERLEEAARSMVVFQNTTEYEGRRALMVSLQNQLEASLSASLVAAISARDVKACKSFYAIFGQIQREAEFTSYYFGSRRAILVDSWSSAILQDCPTGQAAGATTTTTTTNLAQQPTKFTSFLARFYSDLHALFNEEQTYIPAIFPDPNPTLSAFIQTTLEVLTPSLPQRLSALADFHGPRVLPELIQAYRATEEFALLVDRAMHKMVVPPSSPLPPPSTPVKKDRRLSKRLSTSKRLGRSSLSFGGSGSGAALLNHLGATVPGASLNDEPLPAWEVAIFEPFLEWQIEYPELERQYLVAAMSDETGSRNVMAYLTSGLGSERALADHTTALFTVAEDAVGRLLALTHGYAAAGFVSVVDGQLSSFFDRRRHEVNDAKKGGQRVTASSRLGGDEEAALEGLEYSHEDWSAFQAGLRLLDTCRSISDRLATFEVKLRSRLTTLAQAVKEARSDPMHYTIPGTTRGAVTLLRQSNLNSSDLSGLLSPFERSDLAAPISFSSSANLLPRARSAASDMTKAVQAFLCDIILAPLLGHLKEYSTLPVWSTSEQQRPGGKGDFDLSIPTFSLSPTETISRVGEGLFNLPRLFEVYAANDGLAFSIETLPFVDVDTLFPPPASPPTPRAATHRMPSFTDSTPEGGAVPPSPSLGSRRTLPPSAVQAPPTPSPSIPPLSAEAVIATWLSSLTLSVLSHLTTTVLPSITRLTRHGSAQLASDLSYISNVAKALDVDSPDELLAWRDAVEVDDPSAVAAAASDVSAGGDGATVMSLTERAVYDRVNKIRSLRK